MEGISKSIEQQENISWETLRAESTAKAKDMIDGILGYEYMTPAEKISAVHFLLHELAEDNKNRYLAQAVAVQLSGLIEDERHEKRKSELKKAA
ncbi:MAG TPA: hypothetical protein PKD95_02270 [Candidatus Paceibacterota bacterium]|nr:hypothetical protein [Candidatus Paceibacterota bacterium]